MQWTAKSWLVRPWAHFRAARSAWLLSSGAASAILLSCGAGSIDDPATRASSPNDEGAGASPSGTGDRPGPSSTAPLGSGAPPPLDCNNPQPGSAPIRRLTRTEYNNTVRDLLGDGTHPADVMPSDKIALGFDNDIEAHGVTEPLARQYMIVAEGISQRATADLAHLLPCDPSRDEEGCARTFVSSLGKRAYRRPLADDEVTSLLAVFHAGRAGNDFKNGVQFVLETVLQSPDFLYRVEFGQPTAKAVTPLDGWELATRLSYFFWATMPDDDLQASASGGKLQTPADVEREARRMLRDPRATPVIESFYAQWLGIDALDGIEKSAVLYPDFEAIRHTMKDEWNHFVGDVTAHGDLTELLTAPYTYADSALASFYRISSPASTSLTRVELDPRRASGILTQGSFLSVNAKPDQTSPVRRGVTVLAQLLCAPPPPPPANANTTPPPPSSMGTTRDRFTAHEQSPTCASCHHVIDSIGFGFEHFDAVGRYRDTENGLPVNAEGALLGTDMDGPFNGAAEMGARLSKSPQVRACFTEQWFRFAHGRGPLADDACTLAAAGKAFAASGNRIEDLLLAFTQTDAFLYRTRVTP